MTTEEFKTNIQEALQAFAKGNLTENSLGLFNKLGYVTERRAPLDKPTFDEFQDTYISDQRFDEAKARVKEWKYVDLLFQLSKEEVSQQANLFDTKQVDKTIIETYLFFALELTGEEYNRTDLSNITREINRLFPMPVMVLFKYGNKLTFSVINRRLHKRDESKDVLEKITLIKDISIESPLRAHIEILFDLSFQELLNKHQFTNFVELHNAWQKTLDTKELNIKFFNELANWYFWAMDKVQFPDDIEKKKEVRNATNLIRLITRVIFIWFIKEKHLVPASLFNEKYLEKILKDFLKNKMSSNYYQAILQNLFFGTLNQKMDERDFAEDHNRTNKLDQGIKNKYRYPDKFNITKKEIINLFKDIPFLNGGLFDCLDKFDEEKLEKGKKEQIFVDGFTRLEGKQAILPDYLFFGEEVEVDLKEYYYPEAKKAIIKKAKGLFHILNSYKFTVAENTPIEEEIALDPELLGKVFENLLASYNPETKTTARKQTGSFYTPREIVNYMVDESLIAYFQQSLDSIPAVAEEKGISVQETLSKDAQWTETLSKDAQWTFFNPNNEIDIHQGKYPHWQQKDVWYFITFRLGDSIPAKVVEEIKLKRELWLKKHPDFKNLTKEDRIEYYRLFSERVENLLHAGRGSCVLKDQKVAKIVSDALLHFNNERYILDEWVIMPNHVHILVKPLEGHTLPDITHSWKSFTANEINKVTGNKGQLWMHESYDHIVRNEKALEAIRNYIRQNPVKAKLAVGEYLLAEGREAFGTFEARLRNLFSYNDDGNPFNSKETDLLIEAINNAKILDPACGSGAFPMGVLHKMVHLLQKLDPGNVKWKAQQKEKIIGNQIKELEKDKKAIEGLSDKSVRGKAIQAVDERLKEIDEIFESKNNFDDYARKLYLIENCIYGIDIQPIAVQISKLRFFISLIIDQKVHKVHPSSLMDDKPKDNLGIRPLPNLETKFVAANTLISLEIPTTDLFYENNSIKLLQEQLKATRHEYFNAKTRKDKLNLQKQDKELRKKIAAQISDTLINKKEEKIANLEKQLSEAKKKLAEIEAEPEQKETIETTNLFGQTETTVIDKKKEKIKVQKSTISLIEKQINSLKATDNKDAIQKVAQQISSFDPYDQNHFANWFEPEWMFGNDVKDGFDIVIGNPPYIRIQNLPSNEVTVLKQKYTSATGKFDIYVLFNEKAYSLLNDRGNAIYIMPNKFFTSDYGIGLRTFLSKKKALKKIVDFGAEQVFDSATTYTAIIQTSKINFTSCEYYLSTKLKDFYSVIDNSIEFLSIDYMSLDGIWRFSDMDIESIFEKMNRHQPLSEYTDEIFQGLISGGDKLLFLILVREDSSYYYGESQLNGNTYKIEKGIAKKLLKGSEIQRYKVPYSNFIAIYPYKLDHGATSLFSESELSKLYPEAYHYLNSFKAELSNRGSANMIYEKWYSYWNSRKLEKFNTNKILTQVLASKASYTIDFEGNLFVGGGNAGGYGIIPKKGINLFYLLGLLNSHLLDFYLKKNTSLFANGFYSYAKRFIQNIPIKIANEREMKIISNAAMKIIELKRKNSEADTSQLEKQIDEMVYKLYELTEEEIAIIEGKNV